MDRQSASAQYGVCVGSGSSALSPYFFLFLLILLGLGWHISFLQPVMSFFTHLFYIPSCTDREELLGAVMWPRTWIGAADMGRPWPKTWP